MTTRAGSVYWGVVPFVPEAPFRLYAGAEAQPVEVRDPSPLFASAASGGDSQLTYLVPGKVRPVLVISDGAATEFREVLALRLTKFTDLTPNEQARIRDQESADHFHLSPSKFKGLPEENAVLIPSLVRLHESALDTKRLGTLNQNELAVVHQRLVARYNLDIRQLVHQRLQGIAAAQAAKKQP